GSPSPAASTIPSPMTQATSAAAPEVRQGKTSSGAAENAMLNQAREEEEREHYREAIALYDEYLRENPHAAEAKAVAEHLETLKQLELHLGAAMMAVRQQNYFRAAQQFKMALALRPESRKAQRGLDAARSRTALRPPPDEEL